MPRKKVTFDTVREVALALPDVEETTSWGMPSFKAKGKLLAVQAGHKSAEPETLVVVVDYMEREALMKADPDVYYLKPHYLNNPCVLVRLPRITQTALEEVLETAHQYVTRKKRK